VPALQVECRPFQSLLLEHGCRSTGGMDKFEGDEELGCGVYTAQLRMLL
jgi:hypothetical protein